VEKCQPFVGFSETIGMYSTAKVCRWDADDFENMDHSFIEDMERIGPNHFKILSVGS
jgi:hypothetical protein